MAWARTLPVAPLATQAVGSLLGYTDAAAVARSLAVVQQTPVRVCFISQFIFIHC